MEGDSGFSASRRRDRCRRWRIERGNGRLTPPDGCTYIIPAQLVGRPPRTITRRVTLNPPAVAAGADVDDIEPEPVNELGHHRLRVGIVSGDSQRVFPGGEVTTLIQFVVVNQFRYARSVQLRGAAQISSGNTLTATGIATCLESKNPPRFALVGSASAGDLTRLLCSSSSTA